MTLRELFTWLIDMPYLGTFTLWALCMFIAMSFVGNLIARFMTWRENRKYMKWKAGDRTW
jgi:NADH:ubiquinone oxidoreductase subunit 3 (subunit A)